MSQWISPEEWHTIVENVPIVSVDLLVVYEGKLVFGKRQNEPAKDYWFVPGGRVYKGETREEAAHRIAEQELGLEIEIVESLGAYEHFYDTADVAGVDSKHYLANGYVVTCLSGELEADDQHESLRLFNSPPTPLHEYIKQFLTDATSLPEWP
ncbi:GDP-mannose mannosyl hydrolase [Haladaptatus sp. CMSO5]|uniref:GDP-mannose mannosyl hydrolase n=1 Tax=Haladaptatus sp. CMSO5 TaxID=3120514 RepID=UPI002FCE548B